MIVVSSDAVAEASFNVEVSVNSDVVAVSGKDNVTDTVKAKSAKRGRDKVNYCTGAGPGWETYNFIAPSHPHAEVTKLLCPHHEGAGNC